MGVLAQPSRIVKGSAVILIGVDRHGEETATQPA